MSIPMDELLAAATVIPVLSVSRIEDAAPLARVLETAGLGVIEMTWRTEVALEVMAAMKRETPRLLVGIGTIRRLDQIGAAERAGADFLVSPGLTRELAPALRAASCPVMPGVATASEAMQASDAGFDVLKFFPAESAGGVDYLTALSGPLPDLRFCPTGGVTSERTADYLALPNVPCVGGTWIASRALIETRAWDAIASNAAAAAAMEGSPGVNGAHE